MIRKRSNLQDKEISRIEEKIKLTQKINLFELKKLLELHWEITIEYNGEVFEIIMNGHFIELYSNCFYDRGKWRSTTFAKFASVNEFIEDAKIYDKKISQIIDEIIILHC